PSLTSFPYTTLFRSRLRDRAAGRDGRRDGRGRGGGLLPRLQRALRDALRAGQLVARPAGQLLGHGQRLLLPARPLDARRVGEGVDRKSTRLNSSHVS